MDAELKKMLCSLPNYDPFDVREDIWEFDVDRALHVIDFFQEYIRHTKGPLARELLELADFQIATMANIYGWVHKETRNRRYQTAFIYLPRKNGKSTWIAGFPIYHQLVDPMKTLGAEIYTVATEKDQARAVFDQTKLMIKQDAELSAEFECFQHSICIQSEGSATKLLSADAGSKHGFNSTLIIYDEIHNAKNRDLYDVLNTSTGAQANPLFIMITTADFHRESICNEQLDYAEKVCQGIIKDDRFLPVLFQASIEDDWTDPKVWYAANPNLGVSVRLDYFEAQCRKAQDVPTYENTFKRLHLNIKTEQAHRWLKMQKWDQCNSELAKLEGRRCFAGLDLASTTDVACLVLLFEPPEDGDGIFDILPIFWIPESNAYKREKTDKVPYRTWVRQGHMRMTEGDVIDYDVIRKDINELGKLYDIAEIAIDRWAAAQITTQLQGDGFDMVPFGQGYKSMSPACKGLEKMVIGVQCRHAGHPVLRWMASNLAVEEDSAENVKFSKKKSSEKIDGMVSLAMAYGRYDANAEVDTSSIYDDNGIDFI